MITPESCAKNALSNESKFIQNEKLEKFEEKLKDQANKIVDGDWQKTLQRIETVNTIQIPLAKRIVVKQERLHSLLETVKMQISKFPESTSHVEGLRAQLIIKQQALKILQQY